MAESAVKSVAEWLGKLVVKEVKYLHGDVLEAVSAFSAEKTPGQDEFTSKFFTASWGIVGKDISEAVLGFFHDC
ncbi:hypothetical protein Dimus_008755 [Dionaea muscipula]